MRPQRYSLLLFIPLLGLAAWTATVQPGIVEADANAMMAPAQLEIWLEGDLSSDHVFKQISLRDLSKKLAFWKWMDIDLRGVTEQITGCAECFDCEGEGIFDGNLRISQPKRSDPANLRVEFYVIMYKTDGTTEAKYHLDMPATINGPWLPQDVNDEAILTITSWEMAPVPQDRHGACEASASADGDGFEVVVHVRRDS